VKARRAALHIGAALLAAALLAGRAAAAPEELSFGSADHTRLRALVVHPEGLPSRGTVVALHGCGGLYASGAARPQRLNARHQVMAEMLTREGYSVVFPDSLTPRGETTICTQRIGSRAVTSRERRADALATLSWVQAQPWAAPDRIALLGWSHGGSAVLATIDATRPELPAFRVRPVMAIAFYPGCGEALRRGWRTEVPLVLMLAENDDWTPAAPCVQLGRSAGAEVNVYEASHHGFDNPVGSVRHRSDVPNGVHPGQGVHTGANPVARERAYARLRVLLRQAFP